jgi:hypothetical protein
MQGSEGCFRGPCVHTYWCELAAALASVLGHRAAPSPNYLPTTTGPTATLPRFPCFSMDGHVRHALRTFPALRSRSHDAASSHFPFRPERTPAVIGLLPPSLQLLPPRRALPALARGALRVGRWRMRLCYLLPSHRFRRAGSYDRSRDDHYHDARARCHSAADAATDNADEPDDQLAALAALARTFTS